MTQLVTVLSLVLLTLPSLKDGITLNNASVYDIAGNSTISSTGKPAFFGKQHIHYNTASVHVYDITGNRTVVSTGNTAIFSR